MASVASAKQAVERSRISIHLLGVLCGLTAGAWLGAAEAPTKLVDVGLSPYAVSLCMVLGVFTARWTFPTLLKGTAYVFRDLREKKHLIVWALLAGMLWAVANTLTVYAIKDVGLSIAFPLWNINSLIGIFWGRVLFHELENAGRANVVKVVFGAVAIVIAAVLLAFSTGTGQSNAATSHGTAGVLAALGAGLMWGTMYVPYRKAYISGMNPLSFVTAFTVAEVGTMIVLVFAFDGGLKSSAFNAALMKPLMFWLFCGGFIWVIGDLFQQYAAKYLGIGRGIPLSNTNQLWGLAWGALVFGELAHADAQHRMLVLGGSLLMILGALSISTAAASERERTCGEKALLRECTRYGLEYGRVRAAQEGEEFSRDEGRRWWDYAIVGCAAGVFVVLGLNAARPRIGMNAEWIPVLSGILLLSITVTGWMLWKRTKFF
jgi:drug/metabolite transporter (DMT)-like permease